MLKKIMSVLLVLSLMVGMMPADAFAANSRQNGKECMKDAVSSIAR